jgi:hypothetical protein
MEFVLFRYSDWLQAGWPKGRSSSHGRGKLYLLSTSSKPVLGLIQYPIEWVQEPLSSRVKRPVPEGDHSPAKVINKSIHTSTPQTLIS